MVSYLRQFFLIFVLSLVAPGGGFFAPVWRVYAANAQHGAASDCSPKSQLRLLPKPGRKPRLSEKSRNHNSPRLKRMRSAFVGSTTLRPMARQLLHNRTPAAYAGVEAYARKYAKDAQAWLRLLGWSWATRMSSTLIIPKQLIH